jgi:hypothetical protein
VRWAISVKEWESMDMRHQIRQLVILHELLFSVVLFSSCSIISPTTPTITPTNTTLPSPTTTLTPTITPTPSYNDLPIVISDTFDEDTGIWQTGNINDEYTKGTISIIGGKYYIKITAKKPVFWSYSPKMDDVENVFASVKVDKWDGTKSADYGLLVRNIFYFQINKDYQQYGFEKGIPSEGWTQLTLLTTSLLISPYEPNEIGIRAIDNQYDFFINGYKVDDAKDNTLLLGQVGIGISLYRAGDWIEITFDNFEVRTIPEK